MSKHENVQARIIRVLEDDFDIQVKKSTLNEDFEELGLDSLDLVEIVIEVEEQFSIEIPDETAENFKTPQEVIDYIEGL